MIDNLNELTDEIEAIAQGVAKLRGGRINEKVLLMLINWACPSSERPGVHVVKMVLDAIERLPGKVLKAVP